MVTVISTISVLIPPPDPISHYKYDSMISVSIYKYK